MGSTAGDDVASIDSGGGKEERILVSVRIRPLNEKEIEKSEVSDWECINNNTVIFKHSLPERSMYPSAYTFDRVFGCDNDTKQVYEEGAREVALSVVSGINSSIFAYGQTSSGKTYTMTGITEYSVGEIYEYINKHPEREFVLKFSAMEIYNESVKDLLNPESGPLRLLDDPEKGTIVEKLTEEILRDEDHLRELLMFCETQRQIGETSLNEMSSRSHQILRLTIESSAREFVGKNNFSTLVATVNFVDLAGSERASQALTAGSRLKEGCHINRSLLTLGTVIRKLSKGRNGHVPYRDSKLTRILQSSLGGNARTAIICTMSPARCHIEQSRNTLQFAICAKEVATNAQVNVIMSDKALVKHLRKELARLENELKHKGSTTLTSTSDVLKEKEAQIKKMENEMKDLMRQRDQAHSRLEELLRTVGDDQASGSWEEVSQSYSRPRAPISYDDALSVSETSSISCRIPEYRVSHVHSDSKLCHEVEDQHAIISPFYHSASTPAFTSHEEISLATSPDFDEHFNEVRCIRMSEPSRTNADEFSLLSNEDIDSLLPPPFDDARVFVPEKEVKNEAKTEVELKDELNNVPLQLPVEKRSDFKYRAVVRSRSCRASLINGGTSPWYEELEGYEDTPCNDNVFKETVDIPRPRKNMSASSGFEMRRNGRNASEDSDESMHGEVTKSRKDETYHDGKVSKVHDSIDGLKEVDQILHQKASYNDQDEKYNENEETSETKITIKDVCLNPVLKSSESQSRWKLEFEKKQQEIVELWDACNVSLVHRSYFFLLIKGDPADSIYMEVEHRRLMFLKKSTSQGSPAVTEENIGLEISQKNLRKEREKLCRVMNRMTMSERESIYKKWGVDLKSKQRRVQVAQKVWTDAKDMDHVRESALLVAKLFGFLESGLAPKEMFGLSFAPRLLSHGSYSWKNKGW